MVKVMGTPAQPNALDGVTVMVSITGTVPVLIAVKAGISPVPEDFNPIPGFGFTHEKVVPGTVPDNGITTLA